MLVALPEEMLRQLVDNLTALTCKFAQGAAHEEMVCALMCLLVTGEPDFQDFLPLHFSPKKISHYES